MKFLIFILLCISYVFAIQPGKYFDFGVEGKTYPIVEKDFQVEMLKTIKNFSVNKASIKKQVQTEVEKHAIHHTKLPLCKTDFEMPERQDVVAVPYDVRNPFGRVVFHKGQKIVSQLPKNVTLDVCFVKNMNDVSLYNQINFLSKKYPECVFLVAGKNVLKLRQEFPKYKIYPTNEVYEKRFGIQCYPSVAHMYQDKIKNIYYSYQHFKRNEP